MKSLFEETPIKNKNIVIIDEAPYFVNSKDHIPEEKIQTLPSGAFFRKGEELVTDIRLEFNVNHPQI
jgi:hypothetical protein